MHKLPATIARETFVSTTKALLRKPAHRSDWRWKRAKKRWGKSGRKRRPEDDVGIGDLLAPPKK